MPNLRRATIGDAALIAAHRHSMFQDNNFASEARLSEMDAAFEPWVRERLADGRYVGLFLEEDGHVLAAAGIFFQDFPPHWMDPQPTRAYLLNFYTAPKARGRGFANQLLKLSVEECRTRGIGVITLHASPFGKPIYEKFGFSHSNEMMFRPEEGNRK
ncbi:GNAT family N-acetyltransferase [Granulicella mallensis]|uniref:GCN5-related N-acetyltransferase n=1 Tax=Granulicella mallensis (strain ATCC BAA-1857 / DSM 23137 / MP5ACTX8) TaxID=682795 RepID=G8P248_GRAMM|nr:GNAT family N-acetyltransferase [Granulicella mallensis]AEU38194.1 GCN5-related N-acetyltransferase [Granulicella mallensis MP5ACTX8]